MASYNIYDYDNGDNSPPLVTVVLNDDDSEILEVILRRADEDGDTEEMLRDYMERGATALDALALYTNSYGYLEKVGAKETATSPASEESA